MKRLAAYWLLLIFIGIGIHASGQGPQEPNLETIANPSDQLAKWSSYTSDLYQYYMERGHFSDFSNLKYAAERGLAMTPTGHPQAGMFHFYMGMYYKVQLDHENAISHLKDAIRLCHSQHLYSCCVQSITQLNYLLRFLGRAKETQPYITTLQELRVRGNPRPVKSQILTALAEDYLHYGNYNKSISLFLESLPLKIAEYHKKASYTNAIDLGVTYHNLGNMFLQLNQVRKAIQNFNKAKIYFKDYRGGKVRLLNSYLQAYLNLGKIDSSKYYYDQVYAAMVNRELFYESAELSNANQYFANYYLERNSVSKATEYVHRAEEFALASGRMETLLRTKFLLGQYAFSMQQFEKAITYFSDILPKSDAFGKDFKESVLLRLAQTYEKTGDYKKSLQYFQEHDDLANEILINKTNEEITDIEIKHQTQEKQKEIAYLNGQQKLTLELVKKQEQLQGFLILVIILVLMVSVLYFINYQSKKRSNAILDHKVKELDALNVKLSEANHTKTKLFSILSHDLRNPISELFSFLRLLQGKGQKMSVNEEGEYRQHLLLSSHQLMETMEDMLLWSKSQMDRFEVDAEEIQLTELLAAIFKLYHIQLLSKGLTLNQETSAFNQIKTDLNLLLTILRNLFQNAINHAMPNTDIRFETIMEHQNKVIQISNQPIGDSRSAFEGVQQEKQINSSNQGYGLYLVKDMALKIQARVEVCMSEDQRIQFRLVFPSE